MRVRETLSRAGHMYALWTKFFLSHEQSHVQRSVSYPVDVLFFSPLYGSRISVLHLLYSASRTCFLLPGSLVYKERPGSMATCFLLGATKEVFSTTAHCLSASNSSLLLNQCQLDCLLRGNVSIRLWLIA